MRLPSLINFRRPFNRRVRRIGSQCKRHTILLYSGDFRVRGVLVGIRPPWRASADQPDMVEERSSESTHEEVVGKNVASRDSPHWQRASIIVPHDKRAGISIGNEHIVAAAVDLHLILIKSMPEIARGHAERQPKAGRVVDRKRPVGEVLCSGLGNFRLDARWREAAPDRRQLLKHRAVPIALHKATRAGVTDAVCSWEGSVERVEATVLGINNDNCLDRPEITITRLCDAARTRPDCHHQCQPNQRLSACEQGPTLSRCSKRASELSCDKPLALTKKSHSSCGGRFARCCMISIRRMNAQDMPAARFLLSQLGYVLGPEEIRRRYDKVTSSQDHALMVGEKRGTLVALCHVFASRR